VLRDLRLRHLLEEDGEADAAVRWRTQGDELVVDPVGGPAERRLPERDDDRVVGAVDDDVVRMEVGRPVDRRRPGAHRQADRAAPGYSRTRRYGSRPRDRDTRFARSAIWCWSRRM